MLKKSILSAVLIASSSLVFAAGKADFDAAYKAAEAARARAAGVEYEWNTIGPLLAKAKQAAEAGDYDAAVKLADEAKTHGDLAYKQSQIEEKHWRDAVVK